MDHLPFIPQYAAISALGYATIKTALVGCYKCTFGTVGAFLMNLVIGSGLVLGIVVAAATLFVGSMFVLSVIQTRSSKVVDWNQWVSFKDPALVDAYGNSRVPMEKFIEDFFAKKVDLKSRRPEHFRYVLTTLLPQGMSHKQKMDVDEVQGTYDRGNDFYRAFLGPMMVYTSAIFSKYEDTLEEAQRNKLDLVCRKIQLKAGEKLLDIGCGWGTLGIHASKYFGAKCTAVTIAKEQVEWARNKAKLCGVSDSVEYKLLDYRDIPAEKYNKITCLEMAEHVGIKNFPSFMKQVYDMLEDDGIFYLQIAGLRRRWQFEDLVWGMFMGKYIFPAADASCPLAWVVNQLEQAGFEVQSHENIGIHYSETISRWLDNCVKNRTVMVEKYGERWYRIWVIFLAWSMMIAAEGGSTCHMIVAYKNKNSFDRRRFVGNVADPPTTRAVGNSSTSNAVLFAKDQFGNF